jgi:uncharacterized membrane protein
MAGQKRARSTQPSSVTATKSGQRQTGRGGQARTKRPQSGAPQNAPQNGRSPGGRDGRPQNGRAQDVRAPNGRPGRAGGPPGRAVLTAEPDTDSAFAVPAWLQWTTLALSVVGLGVSVYLTIAHYTSPKILDCSANGLIDCTKVTTSPQSVVFGVFPVAVLGLAFYVFMVAINTPWAWRARLPAIWWARLGSVVGGIGFVLYLIYVEVIQIGNICLWCTSVHVVTFALFVLLIFAATLRSGETATAR